MNLELLTCVWGKPHINLFEKTALRSLSWDRNKEALKYNNAKWNIFTDDIEYMKQIVEAKDLFVEFNIQGTDKLRAYIDQVQAASIWQIEESIKNKSKVLLAPPDTIFGDGTVENLLAAGQDEGSVVCAPHPRVLPSILGAIERMPLPLCNSALVTWGFAHLHDAWVHAERGHPNQSSYVGGVEWWKVGGIIQGTHRLPSPYLIEFTEEDLQYFKSAISMGHWDHVWPGDILIPRGRQRYLGSSEAAFIVEITEADKNVPPIIENQPKTGFWRNNPHNHHNSQIIFTFRGA